MTDPLADDFCRLNGVRARGNVPGRDLTTYAIGGPLALLVEPQSVDELRFTLNYLAQNGRSYRVLGAGSNLLIGDAGVQEWVIRLGAGFRSVEYLAAEDSSTVIRVGGAAALMSLSRTAATKGLSGLEFAGGIPASLGGAVRMNAGAHGGEMAEVLRTVTFLTPEGSLHRVAARELPFAYRRSGLPPAAIVIEAELALAHGDPETIQARRAHLLGERKKRQPLMSPSAGSVFKNPSADTAAGALIERCGLKGARCGGAEISTLHANWILNSEKRATADDVRTLIARARTTVQERCGVQLEQELIEW